MSARRLVIVFVAASGLAAVASLSGCFGKRDQACELGTERCGCFGNGTCHGGLACLSETCVSVSGTPDGGGNGSGGGVVDPGGTGGSGGVSDNACLSCGRVECAGNDRQCQNTPGCSALISCILGCDQSTSCIAACSSGASATAVTVAQTFVACTYMRCIDACTPGGIVDPGTGGTTPITGSGGRAASPGTGGRAGTPGTGGSPVAPGTGGAPTTLVPGVNWLVLEGNGAPESEFPNSALGINGVFYAFGDPCATLNWDPATRCLSGRTCPFSAINWGVAIGFDMHNTGASGTPPDTKFPWNATTAGARGVAWSVSGTSSFQVWITNMDPMWGGQCSAASCSINGPPDGTTSPQFDGTLLFSSLTKEYWGGAGIPYAFNPANILALQFKIPSGVLGSASYQICVDQVGIVR